jgi:hypothetical protein
MKHLHFLLLFFSLQSVAQKSDVFHIDSLPSNGVLLDKGWKWHPGDNPEWAKIDFDDSAWASIDPTKEITELADIRNARFG